MLRLLRHNLVMIKDLDRIVSRLKDFYEAETPTQKITNWGRIENLKISTSENAELQLERHASLVLDATFSRREHRDELRRLLNAKSANYCFIEAEAPDEVFTQRLEQRKGASHVVSDARLEDFEMLKRSYETASEIDTHYCLHVATDGPTAVTILQALKGLVLARFESNSP